MQHSKEVKNKTERSKNEGKKIARGICSEKSENALLFESSPSEQTDDVVAVDDDDERREAGPARERNNGIPGRVEDTFHSAFRVGIRWSPVILFSASLLSLICS